MGQITRSRVMPDAMDDGYSTDEVIQDIQSELDEADAAERRTHRPDPTFKRNSTSGVKRAVSSGWGAPVEERTENVKAPNLVLKDKGKRIVKVLDDMPPVKYKRHYLNSKKRYYTCPQVDCPLCEAGIRASWTFVMNVIDMVDNPSEVKVWTFGNEVSAALQSLGETKALDDSTQYFEVYHEKIANRDAPATRVQRLKARDLPDDYDLEPLNEDEISILKDQRYGEEVVFMSTISYLETVAEDLVRGDFPKGHSRNP